MYIYTLERGDESHLSETMLVSNAAIPKLRVEAARDRDSICGPTLADSGDEYSIAQTWTRVTVMAIRDNSHLARTSAIIGPLPRSRLNMPARACCTPRPYTKSLIAPEFIARYVDFVPHALPSKSSPAGWIRQQGSSRESDKGWRKLHMVTR